MAVSITKSYTAQNFQSNGIIYGYSNISQQNQPKINFKAQNIKSDNSADDDTDSSATNNEINTSEPANTDKQKKTKENGKNSTDKSSNPSGLTEKQLRIIDDLKARDAKVRRHEMAHIAAGGQYITSGVHYKYEKGPDGKNYAVGGDVSIDTSPVPGDPEATIAKMRKVEQAALAPADPSPQDKKVAAESAFVAAKALSELMMMQEKQRAETIKEQFQSKQNPGTAANAYEQTSTTNEPTAIGNNIDIAA